MDARVLVAVDPNGRAEVGQAQGALRYEAGELAEHDVEAAQLAEGDQCAPVGRVLPGAGGDPAQDHRFAGSLPLLYRAFGGGWLLVGHARSSQIV